MKKFVTAAMLSVAAIALGGDGTLPFNMREMSGTLDANAASLRYKVVSPGSNCNGGIHSGRNAGTVVYRSSSYTIRELCTNGRDSVNILANGSRGNLRLNGNLSRSNQLEGNLQLNQSNVGRFKLRNAN